MIADEIKRPVLSNLIKKIEELNNKAYEPYFKEKLGHIARLENELKLIQGSNPAEFLVYATEHCPQIKTKYALIHEIFYRQEFYAKQIAATIKNLESRSKCQNHTDARQRDLLLSLNAG